MKIIAHRGNTVGSDPDLENHRGYILSALLQGFDVEIDIWHHNEELYLGHDEPVDKAELSFLSQYKDQLWIHCKNVQAFEFMLNNPEFNAFFHQKDEVTLTIKGYLWTFTGGLITPKSIAVMPENVESWDIKGAFGVCTDYPARYKFKQ
jgi:hypothetical protein